MKWYIDDISKRFKVTRRTLKSWNELELLVEPSKDENGHLFYDEVSAIAILNIQIMHKIGLSLYDIKLILPLFKVQSEEFITLYKIWVNLKIDSYNNFSSELSNIFTGSIPLVQNVDKISNFFEHPNTIGILMDKYNQEKSKLLIGSFIAEYKKLWNEIIDNFNNYFKNKNNLLQLESSLENYLIFLEKLITDFNLWHFIADIAMNLQNPKMQRKIFTSYSINFSKDLKTYMIKWIVKNKLF